MWICRSKVSRLAVVAHQIPKRREAMAGDLKNRPSVLSNAVADKEVPKLNKTLSKSPDLPISHNEKPKTSSGRTNRIDVERIELDRQQEEIIKKVAAFKPLINSASANVDLTNDGNKKIEKSEKKNGSTKELKEKPRERREAEGDKKKVKSSMVDLNDTDVSPTDKVLANRSNAPSKNALNFNVLQQQQQQQQSSGKNTSAKSPTRRIP